MNIEIANRLAELRKKSGLSQEQLAERLGLSRQAVSKWERAEASPDTDNLICLARIYGVSLDDLLNTDQTIDEIVRNREEAEQEKQTQREERTTERSERARDSVHIGFDGIHVHSADGDEVSIGPGGIHVNDGEVVIDGKTTYVLRPNEEEKKRRKRISMVQGIVTGSLAIIITVLYVVFGCLYQGVWPHPLVWPIGWVAYLLIPIVSSFFEFAKLKKASCFTAVFVMGSIIAFMILGMAGGFWHPGWVVFLSIPLWSIIAKPIDDATKQSRQRNYVRVPKTASNCHHGDDDDDDDDDDD